MILQSSQAFNRLNCRSSLLKQTKLADVPGEDLRRESSLGPEKPDDQKKIAYRIQEAGGLRNWLVDELARDRRDQGAKDVGLEEPKILSPAAKERLRKNEELNAQVIQATRSAGIIITGSCLALLYLAKIEGLTQ